MYREWFADFAKEHGAFVSADAVPGRNRFGEIAVVVRLAHERGTVSIEYSFGPQEVGSIRFLSELPGRTLCPASATRFLDHDLESGESWEVTFELVDGAPDALLLPRPGGEAQLRGHVARLLERHLDRARPLWEIWLIEGLEGGRFAMLTKVHHCMVDGIGGVQLLSTILGLEPTRQTAPIEPWQPRPAPQRSTILRREMARRTGSSSTGFQAAPFDLRHMTAYSRDRSSCARAHVGERCAWVSLPLVPCRLMIRPSLFLALPPLGARIT